MMTKEQFISKFNQNPDQKELIVTVLNGYDQVIIKPVSYAFEINSIKDVDFYLAYSSLLDLSCDNLDNLIDSINHYEDRLNKWKKDVISCFVYFKTNNMYDDRYYSFYSDWHKDLFGARPSRDHFNMDRNGRICKANLPILKEEFLTALKQHQNKQKEIDQKEEDTLEEEDIFEKE